MGTLHDSPLEIDSLLAAGAFPHPADQIELIETHISWVILSGQFAYKIKKPVDFGFVNYLSLEDRHSFCDLELTLNRRFAPSLYLDVVPILKGPTGLHFAESGRQPAEDETIVDYAVKMKQFPQDAIVAQRLELTELTPQSIETFGASVAQFHDQIERIVPTHPCAAVGNITRDATDNFQVTCEFFEGDPRIETLTALEAWTLNQLTQLGPKFAQRARDGKIRRCHGDLHLKNIIQIDDRLIAFDGIEFNESLQCVDVLAEIAFPAMDFHARGRSDLAWRLLNGYLEITGDYQDLDVLRFYLVYRAMVRAKVTCLNPANQSPQVRQKYETGDPALDALAGPWDKYLKTADFFAYQLQPGLGITHGFSGSGKSTVAMSVIDRDGGVRIRSDVERHRIGNRFNLSRRYTAEVSRFVYETLLDRARCGLQAGFPIIVDATFLKRQDRESFTQLAQELGVEFSIVDCDAPYEVLCERIRTRTDDPSEADINVLNLQMKNHDPLTTDELQFLATRCN